MNHQHAVAAAMDIEFDEIHGENRGIAEGEAAVLGPDFGASAMRGDVRHISVTKRGRCLLMQHKLRMSESAI